MAVWQNPITDRTLADVEYAKENPSSTANLKGCMNISDFNRVSTNLIWIKENIPMSEYPVTVIPPAWVRTDFFLGTNLQDYETDIYYLHDLFALNLLYPEVDFGQWEVYIGVWSRKFTYEKVNQWERIIFYTAKLFADSITTWGDVYDFGTWQQVLDFFDIWGKVFKWKTL